MASTTLNCRSRDSYFELIQRFPLRPLRSDADFNRAISVLLTLETSKPATEMDAGERDYADALAMFLREFERARHLTSLLTLAPVDRLKFLMAEKAMTVNELGKVLGSQSSASLILHGKRAISKAHILKLSQHFAVSPALFIE